MAGIVEIVERHPYATAGVAVVGALVVYLLLGSGGSSTGTVTATGPTDAEVNAAAALQAQQAGFAQQNVQDQVALSSQQQNNAAQIQLATIQAQTSTQQQVNAIAGQETITQDQLSTQQAISLAEIQAQSHAADVAASTEIAAQNAALTLGEFETSANVGIAQINAQQNVSIAQITSAEQTSIAQFQAQTAQAEITAVTGVQKQQVAAQSQGNVLGFVGDVLGSLF